MACACYMLIRTYSMSVCVCVLLFVRVQVTYSTLNRSVYKPHLLIPQPSSVHLCAYLQEPSFISATML